MGDDIARRLIGDKIAGQAETLIAVDRIVPVPHVAVRSLRVALTRSMSLSAGTLVKSSYGMATWTSVIAPTTIVTGADPKSVRVSNGSSV
jgi:hypothetical protein